MLFAVFWFMLIFNAFHITSTSPIGGDELLLPSYVSKCEEGWTLFQGSCYKQYSTRKLTWQSARSSCQSNQADLVVVKNDAENNFLFTTFKTRVWIGLTDLELEGTFKWITTGTEPSYTNFITGEPNNQGNEDCVEINSVHKGEWNDLPCSRYLNYVCEKDNEPPKLQCPQKTSNYYTTNYGSIIYATTDDGSPNGTITWTPLVAEDNSGIPPTITNFPYEPGEVFSMNGFPPYTTTIRATDESGNSKECQIHFVVVDIESPVVICPSYSNNFVARSSESSWSVFTDGESRSARLYWSPANATDNTGTVVSVYSNHNPGDVFPLSSVAHQITYTAIDGDNNVGNCSFFITVKELENPSVKCPSHLQVYTDDGSRFAFLSWNITLNDNFAVVHYMSNDSRVVPDYLTLNHTSITLAQNGSFSIGTNLVEYVATDMSGNIGKCLLTITVTDNERPSITCPSSISNYYDHIFAFHRLVADYGRPYATVTWSPPEYYDNSQESVKWESFPYTSGDTFRLQQFPPYNVKFTASDMFGNNRSCDIYFTVIDIEAPNITCPTNITNYYDTYYGIIRAALDPGSSTSTVTWDAPTVSDNSGRHVNVTSSYQSGDSFPPRFYPPYEVEYIAEDESGNKNSCKFYFLVTDYDSYVTSNSGTVNEHTITSAVKGVSSTLSTVTNMDEYNTDKYKNVTESALESASSLASRISMSSSSSSLSSSSSSSLTKQVPDQQTTNLQSNFTFLSTKMNINSQPFPTTVDRASSLQNENVDTSYDESVPTVPSEVFISKNIYKTADDNIYNSTSSYNIMTSRLAVRSKIKSINNNGIGGVTIAMICLCILGVLSFFIVITFIIKKKRHDRPKLDTKLHSSNPSVLDFENPAFEIFDLQNLDKELVVSKSEEGLSSCEYV
ncbi:hyalin-like [Anneissia japonica]|uniref:hyalin-like n=1 Tax=Anneissia japonica TaxID=1529436 RepID=UPI0014258B7C|nr:hyalin-like [Anneissia japonica]